MGRSMLTTVARPSRPAVQLVNPSRNESFPTCQLTREGRAPPAHIRTLLSNTAPGGPAKGCCDAPFTRGVIPYLAAGGRALRRVRVRDAEGKEHFQHEEVIFRRTQQATVAFSWRRQETLFPGTAPFCASRASGRRRRRREEEEEETLFIRRRRRGRYISALFGYLRRIPITGIY